MLNRSLHVEASAVLLIFCQPHALLTRAEIRQAMGSYDIVLETERSPRFGESPHSANHITGRMEI